MLCCDAGSGYCDLFTSLILAVYQLSVKHAGTHFAIYSGDAMASGVVIKNVRGHRELKLNHKYSNVIYIHVMLT